MRYTMAEVNEAKKELAEMKRRLIEMLETRNVSKASEYKKRMERLRSIINAAKEDI